MAKPKVLSENGVHWFSQAYAAQLLGTTRGKIKVMVMREIVRSHPLLGDEWVAEIDINRIRNDPEELKGLKQKVQEMRAMRPPEIGGMPQVGPDQNVLPIADYRLPLRRGIRYKE